MPPADAAAPRPPSLYDEREMFFEITSTPIFFATIAESTANVWNVVACVYLISRVRTTRLMHKNLKTLLISLSANLILFNAVRFVKSFGYFMVQRDTKEMAKMNLGGGYFIFANRFCMVNRFFYDATVNVLSLTMLGILLERVAATRFVKYYEMASSDIVARSIVALQWIGGFLTAASFLAIDEFQFNYWNAERLLVTCSFVYTRPGAVLGFFAFSVFLFCPFSIIAVILYRFNRYHYNKSESEKLTIRYQYKENVTTLMFLVPLMTAFGMSNVISASLISYMFIHVVEAGTVDNILVDRLWKVEKAYNATVTLYTVVFVFLCVRLHRPLWDTFRHDLRCLTGKKRARDTPTPTMANGGRLRMLDRNGKFVNVECEGDVYFKNLQSTWK